MSVKSELDKIEKAIITSRDEANCIDAFIYSVIGDDLEVIERYIEPVHGSRKILSEDEYQAIINDPDHKIIRWCEGEAIDLED
jgi:hypothetical protein